jgi:Transcriptional regulator, AbiEi antitoxin
MAKHTGYEDPELSTLIHSQYGVLTAAQAKAGGLPHETLRRRVQRGLWQRLVPGVYALQGGPPSRLQWLVAAQLYAGERSVLTGRAALAVHGIRLPAAGGAAGAAGRGAEGYGVAHGSGGPDGYGVPGEPGLARHRLDALIPHGTRRQSVAHLRIIRTTRVPEATRIGVLRVAPLARSAVDGCLAAVEDRQPESIDAIVTATLENGAVQLAELEYELGKTSRKHSAAIRAELRKSRAHARASAVREFLRKLGTSGPFGAMQDAAIYLGQRRVARAVAVWPERAVAVIVDPHPVEVSTLASLGFAVIRVTSEQLEREAEGVLRRLREGLRDRPTALLPPGVAMLPLTATSEMSTSASPKSVPRKEPAHA